ncbi:MAG: hypothetical protein ACFFDN_28045, partial [Candidatus Hodarchaeota archaeon]
DIIKYSKSQEKPIGFILGNKSDLHNERVISQNEAAKLANELNLIYFETSALTGENVNKAFEALAETLYIINK